MPKRLSAFRKQHNAELRFLRKSVVNSGDKNGFTPFHIAAFTGDIQQIRYFLKLGADPNQEDLLGKTPLQ